MHEGVDFLYEVVANSIEAGAKNISLRYVDDGSKVDVTVRDDGEGKMLDWYLTHGTSGKENHSGRGLKLLKERAGKSFEMERKDGWTTVSYSLEKDEGYGKLSTVLPLLFARIGSASKFLASLCLRKGELLLDSADYSGSDETGCILEIRKLILNWE
jgi:Histidine kinase-, DNA gyrase B-, and HSP90-like ATPase.